MPLPNKMVEDLKMIVKSIPKEKTDLITNIFSQDALDAIKAENLVTIPKNKSIKEIVFHFFGMSDNWKLGRNVIGGLMVHSPEYPTYFMPAYTQSKATGDATELKKGEGARGLITGGLEGVAVGALVSGEFIKPQEMVPYIILGAGLQLFSSTVFPWLGEKCGSYIYNKRMKNNAQFLSKKPDEDKTDTFKDFTDKSATLNKPVKPIAYKGYNTLPSGSLRI